MFQVASGGTPSREKLEYYMGGKIPWVKTGDLKGKYTNYPEEHITEEALKNSSAKIFPKNTVLLAMYGATIGACSILPFEAATNQACGALLPTDKVDVDFLFYYLKSIKNDLISKGVGGAQPNISGGIIKQTLIPLLPLKEQKKIANILDAADTLRQNDKALIAKYDELTQALFLDMFGDPVSNPKGWEIDLLSEVADVIMGQSPKGDTYNIDGIGKPLLNGPTEFGVKYPIEKQWTTKPTKFCRKDDILFCVRGATAGKMNWADKEYCIGRGLAAIRSNGITSNDYIYLILERMYNIFQSTSNGSTFINISGDDLRKVKIPRTSESFQNQFAERIAVIEEQKAIAQKSLEKSEELFNSLLQKAFKGELV
ncbi:hypothetical protein FEDK69T_08030 [Flavobacterium enshiense DK69]|nr:hypothetical protein FEDK69T_08030 [Flavobacterium enshiense DK69]